MSIRIALNAPEFYTNLDAIQGRVILGLSRQESISNIVVKLEGESQTALALPNDFDNRPMPGSMGGNIVTESHKLLYQVQQISPSEAIMASGMSSAPGAALGYLPPGQHQFKFKFKMPLNNICGNPAAMAALSGIGGIGGPGNSGMFGLGGYRIMDGSKQLMLAHVRTTLPPSLTGFPQEAEIRYYIKVTIQRPGLFKENWRYQIGFKFLPMEPPRPPKTSQEAFAQRPFVFKPRTPSHHKGKKSFFSSRPTPSPDSDSTDQDPPSIQMSARLPYPSILTCNQPIPLRLIAKKLSASRGQVYLTSVEIALVGHTIVRVHDLFTTEVTRWLVSGANSLAIPIGTPDDPVDTETLIPDAPWRSVPLPNTVAPSFRACNLERRYEVEIKLGLSWGNPNAKTKAPYPQMIFLPLKLSKVEVYSGISPPAELLQSASSRPSRPPQRPQQGQSQHPPLPPRRNTSGIASQGAGPSSSQQQPPHDPLYPPQLGPDNIPPYDDAPPSYDEAMAQELTGPVERPAYSGVTAENSPSTMPPPEKSGLH